MDLNPDSRINTFLERLFLQDPVLKEFSRTTNPNNDFDKRQLYGGLD